MGVESELPYCALRPPSVDVSGWGQKPPTATTLPNAEEVMPPIEAAKPIINQAFLMRDFMVSIGAKRPELGHIKKATLAMSCEGGTSLNLLC